VMNFEVGESILNIRKPFSLLITFILPYTLGAWTHLLVLERLPAGPVLAGFFT